MLEMVAQVGVSALFYDLMKPVNRSLARASAILGFTGCGIKTLARLFYYAPLILLGERRISRQSRRRSWRRCLSSSSRSTTKVRPSGSFSSGSRC
jgi:hypothetical protein